MARSQSEPFETQLGGLVPQHSPFSASSEYERRLRRRPQRDMSFRRIKTGLIVFYQALLSTCLFPQVLVAIDVCIQTLNDRCTNPYKRTVDAAQEPISNEVMCPALGIYLHCVEDVKKTEITCNSNLYYHTISTLIPRLMTDRSCGNVSLPMNQTAVIVDPDTVESATRRPVAPTCVHFKHKQKKLSSGKGKHNPQRFRLCALFGDPHLKTFKDERQTCVVQGAWPLIDNDYFLVQVTNVPVVKGSSATATSMITVMIKPKGNGCVLQKLYRARAGSLPAVFHDGTRETGPKDCSAAIYPRHKGPQTHIEIKICYIRTTIIIRQVGEFLTFHVKIPEKLLLKFPTTGLCVTGCPPRQRIDYRELLSFTDSQLARMRPRRSKMSRKEAYAKCSETKITGFYLDSCLFDLLTTGDKNFSSAAWHALDDSFLLDEMGTLRDLQSYNTTQPKGDETLSDPPIQQRNNSGNRTSTHSFFELWTSMLILFVLAR